MTPTSERLSFSSLSAEERRLVRAAWKGATRAYIPQSNFPVGSALLAQNAAGKTRIFYGCNTENTEWACTCCGERSAIFSARTEGYTQVLKVALVFPKAHSDGTSPCGICRQVLTEFSRDGDFISVVREDNTVIRRKIGDWLPETQMRRIISANWLRPHELSLAQAAIEAAKSSYCPYSGKPSGAAILAKNPSGMTRIFYGAKFENASFGATTSALQNAACNAFHEGFRTFDSVATYTAYKNGEAPSSEFGDFDNISGHSLQILREGGLNTIVYNVSKSMEQVGCNTLDELLPVSFGPDSLA